MGQAKKRPATCWEREPVILDAARTSVLLGLPKAQINRLAKAGKIPAFKVGRFWRFEKNRLMEFAGVKETAQ